MKPYHIYCWHLAEQKTHHLLNIHELQDLSWEVETLGSNNKPNALHNCDANMKGIILHIQDMCRFQLASLI